MLTTDGLMVVTCGSCGAKLRMRAPDEARTGRCPKCGARLRIDPPTSTLSDADAIVPPPAAPPPPPRTTPTLAPRVPEPRTEAPPTPTPTTPSPSAAPIVAADVNSSSRSPGVETPGLAMAPRVAPGNFYVPDWAAQESDDATESEPESKSESESQSNAEPEPESTPQPLAARRPRAHWVKAVILLLAVAVIGAFAWYLLVRFGGERERITKWSALGWLIGMATATPLIATGRTGWPAKIAAALAALFSILLGQTLVVLLALPPTDAAPLDPWTCLRLILATHRFGPVLPLLASLAIAGSATRFILARSD